MDTVCYVLICFMVLLFVWLLLQRLADTGGTRSPGDTPACTGILPSLYMLQLDPDTMQEGKRFVMNDLVLKQEGYTISGSHSKQGMLQLSGKYHHAQYVSTEGATVFMDTDGCYYIQDNNSRNGMTLPDSPIKEARIKIENGTVVYLGIQPVQFFFADNVGRNRPVSDTFDPMGPMVRKKPVRRDAPVYRRR